ncbi:MAG: hypothetical protein HY719_03990 [Planctomycetes bacterium]|nr:hypothetical protein [Planctomycetota bacterium]
MRPLFTLPLLAATLLGSGCVYSSREWKMYEEVIPEVLTEQGYVVHEPESGKFVAYTPKKEWFGQSTWVRITARIVEGPDGFYLPDVKVERQMDDSDVNVLGVNPQKTYPLTVDRVEAMEVKIENEIQDRFNARRRAENGTAREAKADAPPAAAPAAPTTPAPSPAHDGDKPAPPAGADEGAT